MKVVTMKPCWLNSSRSAESLGGSVVVDEQVKGQSFDGRLLGGDEVVEHGAANVARSAEEKNPVNDGHCCLDPDLTWWISRETYSFQL